MGHLLLDDIIKATGAKAVSGTQREFSGLSIDSRTIGKGELFVALKGANFDGHDFLHTALREGAGALVERQTVQPEEGKTLITVTDSLQALQDIARYLRERAGVPVVGVTGTNGKTTTKELVASILGQRHKVLKTRGNLNNHIGLPLCISNMTGDETIMVLEMGSNAEGDIRLLCGIAKPDFAVITNVGPAHLEGFGSLEKVRKTDLEILEYAHTAAVNADDLFLMEGVKGFSGKVITYGMGEKADVRASDISLQAKGASFTLCLADGRKTRVTLALSGRFNIANALAAASVADGLGVPLEEIRRGMESFNGVPMRLEIKEFCGAIVISDVYNANPASMEAALKELVRLKKERTVAVLGDMLELGRFAEDAHRDIVTRMSAMKIDIFIAVGPEMAKAASGFTGTFYLANDAAAARSILLGILKEGDTVLVKGSRGVRMEKVLADDGCPVTKQEEHAL